MVGVLIFDNSFQWAVPIRQRRGPGHDQAPGCRYHAGRRHADRAGARGGVSQDPADHGDIQAHRAADGRYLGGRRQHGALARSGRSNKVTISTVGLGQDVNRAYLEKMATSAQGKSYFLTDPSGLEQILLKDVMEHTGSTAVEKRHCSGCGEATDVLNGHGHGRRPPLRGYVKFIAKPTADDDFEHREKGSAAVILAVRAWPVSGVRFRCKEPVGGKMDHLEWLRQILGECVPRPAAALAIG